MSLRANHPSFKLREPEGEKPEESPAPFTMQLIGLLGVWTMRFASGILSAAGIYVLATGFPGQIPLALVFFFLPFMAANARQQRWALIRLPLWPFAWKASFITTIVGLVMFFTLVTVDAGRSEREVSRVDTTAETATQAIGEAAAAAAAARQIRDQAATRMVEVEAAMKPLEDEVERLAAAMICEETGGCPGWDGQTVTNAGRGPRWRDGKEAQEQAIELRNGFLPEVEAKRLDLQRAEEALAAANTELEEARAASAAAEVATDEVDEAGRYKNIAINAFNSVIGLVKSEPSLEDIQLGLSIFIALAIDAIAVQRAPIPVLPQGGWNDPFGYMKTRRRVAKLNERQVALLRHRLEVVNEEWQQKLDVEIAARKSAERMLEAIKTAQEDAKKQAMTRDEVDKKAVAMRRMMQEGAEPPRKPSGLGNVLKIVEDDPKPKPPLIEHQPGDDDDHRPRRPRSRAPRDPEQREHEERPARDDDGLGRRRASEGDGGE